jgi:hypothetical protein
MALNLGFLDRVSDQTLDIFLSHVCYTNLNDTVLTCTQEQHLPPYAHQSKGWNILK